MTAMLYGGPPVPRERMKTNLPFDEEVPVVPVAPLPQVDRPVFNPTFEVPKKSLRVVSRVNEQGEICLKVYVGGDLKYEAKAEGGTVTVETFLDP